MSTYAVLELHHLERLSRMLRARPLYSVPISLGDTRILCAYHARRWFSAPLHESGPCTECVRAAEIYVQSLQRDRDLTLSPALAELDAYLRHGTRPGTPREPEVGLMPVHVREVLEALEGYASDRTLDPRMRRVLRRAVSFLLQAGSAGDFGNELRRVTEELRLGRRA